MRRRKRTSSLTRAVAGDVAKCTSAASITMNHKRQRDASEPVDEAAVGVDVGVAVNQNEQMQQKHKKPELPEELWAKILESVHENSVAAFACVSKSLRRVQKESGRKLRTDLRMKKMEERGAMMSEEWCLWAMSFLIVGRQEEQSRQIINAAAFSGHLGALKYWKR